MSIHLRDLVHNIRLVPDAVVIVLPLRDQLKHAFRDVLAQVGCPDPRINRRSHYSQLPVPSVFSRSGTAPLNGSPIMWSLKATTSWHSDAAWGAVHSINSRPLAAICIHRRRRFLSLDLDVAGQVGRHWDPHFAACNAITPSKQADQPAANSCSA